MSEQEVWIAARPNGSGWLYVENVHNDAGDRYSYTSDICKAMSIGNFEAKRFCAYVRDCGSVGFLSRRVLASAA